MVRPGALGRLFRRKGRGAARADSGGGLDAPDFERLRLRMVETQIAGRGVRDSRVLAALRKVPRHEFVPPGWEARAYDDEPLPIGEGQTISQPYIVAFMTEALELRAEDRVLEVGTGSGYQTAVLAEIVREVFSVEVIEALSVRARRALDRLGYRNVAFRTGDGARGWSEKAPFDAILVAAAPAAVPPDLRRQLAVGGRMIIPVGRDAQELVLVRRTERGTDEQRLLSVRFVPLI